MLLCRHDNGTCYCDVTNLVVEARQHRVQDRGQHATVLSSAFVHGTVLREPLRERAQYAHVALQDGGVCTCNVPRCRGDEVRGFVHPGGCLDGLETVVKDALGGGEMRLEVLCYEGGQD